MNDVPVAKQKAMRMGAKCAECPLKDRPIVYSSGPDKAEKVACGEAPDYEEVIRKEPFAGKPGQLMNKVLEYHGIKREEVFVTNACLCQPAKNAAPNAKAIAACNDRLLHEVREREPKFVLASGGVAAKALLGSKERITKLRAGGPKPSPYDDYHVIPTFHPAAAMRDPDKFPSIVGDVGKVNRIEVIWEHTKYKVMDDVYKAVNMLERQVAHSKQLVLDVEMDHHTSTVRDPDWLCIGISHRPGGAVVYDEGVVKDPSFQQILKQYLEDPRITWGYQNGKFDVQCLWSFAPGARVGEDTMLAHYLTNEIKGTHDLEQLGAEILGAPNWKQNAKQYLKNKNASLRDLPPMILHQYNAMDTDLTHRLIEPLHREMQNDGVMRPYREILIPASHVLAVAEYNGVEVDVDYLEGLGREFTETLEKAEAACHEIADINIRSNPQLQKFFNADSTDKAFLNEVLEGRIVVEPEKKEFAKRLLEYRKAHKMLSTYVSGLIKRLHDGRIHTNFKLHGTETGRLSSSDPNLQNIPRTSGIRDAFVAREGHTLISADYGQIEYRLAAYFSGDPWLLEQFRNGISLHAAVADALFGPDYDKEEYTRAKVLNFTILYEGGAGNVAGALGIPFKQAAQMVKDWHARAANIRPWQALLKKEAKENGYLTSYFDRKRRFWLITEENWHHVSKEALNFPVQSPASDIGVIAAIKLEEMLRDVAKPVITVHDSLTFECQDEYVEDVARTMKKVMEDTVFAEHVPTPVDLSIGKRWGSAKEVQLT